MSDARLKYGDVVRVDPVISPQVPQPDDRRWMVVSPAQIGRDGTLLYLGVPLGPNGFLSHWSSMVGFVRVVDE